MIWEVLSTGGRLRNSHSEAMLGVEYAKDDSRVVRCVCVCVQSSSYKLGAVRLEIPISSAQFVGVPSIP